MEAEYERERAKAMMGTAYFSTATESSEEDDYDEHDAETVGKKGAARAMAAAKLTGAEGQAASRARAQSTYGASSLQSNQAALPKHRLRSQSTDFRTDTHASGDHQPGRFVDPLVLRRQSKHERNKDNKPLVGPGKKVPVGQLVAFFNSEKSDR